MSRTDDQIDDTSAPLIEHLAELRTRLIRAAIAMQRALRTWTPIGPDGKPVADARVSTGYFYKSGSSSGGGGGFSGGGASGGW